MGKRLAEERGEKSADALDSEYVIDFFISLDLSTRNEIIDFIQPFVPQLFQPSWNPTV